jgi:hypothetical protein
MSNGYFNSQTRAPLGKSGKGPNPGTPAATPGSMAFKERPGFKTGIPGKGGPNRSAGVPRAKTHPSSDGL